MPFLMHHRLHTTLLMVLINIDDILSAGRGRAMYDAPFSIIYIWIWWAPLAFGHY